MCLVDCWRLVCENYWCGCLRLGGLCDDDDGDDNDDDDDDDRSCSAGSSTIFISSPIIDERLIEAPSADYSILARKVRCPIVGIRHVVCAILGDQQDMKHGIAREMGAEWIQKHHGTDCVARTEYGRRTSIEAEGDEGL